MASLPLDPIFAHLLIKSHELGYAHSRLCYLPVNVYLTSQITPLFLSLSIVLECNSHSEVPPILIVHMFVSMHLSLNSVSLSHYAQTIYTDCTGQYEATSATPLLTTLLCFVIFTSPLCVCQVCGGNHDSCFSALFRHGVYAAL